MTKKKEPDRPFVQCKASLKHGRWCTRRATDGEDFCKQHLGQTTKTATGNGGAPADETPEEDIPPVEQAKKKHPAVKKESHAAKQPKFNELLMVKLEDHELQERGKELARCHRRLDQLAEELADQKQRIKADVEAVNSRVSELVRVIESRSELRAVDCTRTVDYALGVVRVVRLDTGEIYSERPLNEDERQMPIL